MVRGKRREGGRWIMENEGWKAEGGELRVEV